MNGFSEDLWFKVRERDWENQDKTTWGQ